MCLQAQVIGNNDGGVGGGRQAQGPSNNNGGVVRGQGIYNVSEISETMTETVGDQRRAQGTYDDNGGVSG